MTVNSSAVAYAAPADLFLRYDLRTIADLVSDVGTRLGGSPNPNPTTVAGSAVLLELLGDASGMVEAACLKGGRYLPTDLQALQAGGGTVGGKWLKRIVCDLTMGMLFERRPDKGKPPAAYEGAMAALKTLAEGEAIFGFLETEAAGNVQDYVETPQDVTNRYLTTREAERFFGRRNNRSGGPFPGADNGRCW